MNYNKYKFFYYFLMSIFISSPVIAQSDYYTQNQCEYHETIYLTDLSYSGSDDWIVTPEIIVSSEAIISNKEDESVIVYAFADSRFIYQSSKYVDLMPGFNLSLGESSLQIQIADCGYSCNSPCDDGDPCTTNDMYVSVNGDNICDTCAGTPDVTACPELSDFTACSANPIAYPSIADDFSGICYNVQTDRFMAVNNGTPSERAYEIDRAGNLIRTISLSGFEDTEGIVHISGNTYAITEERVRNIVFVDITSSNTILDPGSASKIHLNNTGGGNDGLEGLAYDPVQDILFVGRETNDMDVYVIENPLSKLGMSIDPESTKYFDLESVAVSQNYPGLNPNTGASGFTDLAGLSYTPNNSLYLLTHEGETIVEVDPITGDLIGSAYVGFMNHPEGVAVINQNEIVVVGEPNEFMYMVTDLNLCPINNQAFTANTENLDSEIRIDKRLDIKNNYSSVYPNPFSDNLKVELDLVDTERVRIDIIDLQGRIVKNVLNLYDVQKGRHVFDLDGYDLESGLYFIEVHAGDFIQTTKITKL